MAGTLSYMSPEQSDPEATIDSRTDVYSLGVILHELVSGSLPYDLKGLPLTQALQTIREVAPKLATNSGRTLPKDGQAILQKAMHKDRNLRYSSVEALSRDMNRYLHLRPVAARKHSFSYVFGLAILRNRWLAVAGTLLMTAIVVGSAASGLFAWRASAEVQRRRLAETETRRQLDQAVWQSYIANMLGAFSAFQNLEVAQVRSRLAAAPQEHRNWEWDYLNGMVEINDRVIKAHDDMIVSFAQSPDGSRWATGGGNGVLRVWDSQTGKMVREILHSSSSRFRSDAPRPAVTALAFRNGVSQIVSGTSDGAIRIWNCENGQTELQLAGHQTMITTISVSPDGTIASTCSKNRAKLWDVQQTRPLREIKDEQTEFGGVQYCDDGKRMVTWNPLRTLWLRDAETQEILNRFQSNQNIRRVGVSQDGSWIVAGSETNQLQLWQTASSSPQAQIIEIPGKRSSSDSLCFAPDNSRLAIGRIDRQIFEFSLPDFERKSQLQGHEEFVRGLAYTPDGQRLISTSGDGTLREWNLANNVLGNIKVATDGQRTFGTLAISPNGDQIAAASSNRSIQIFDQQLKLARKFPVKHQGQIHSIAWSPNKPLIASAGTDRSVRIWNTTSGESKLLSPPHLADIQRVVFSPDGNWLVSAGLDRVLRVWDMTTQTRGFELFGHNTTVVSLRFSKDGRWLASGAADGSLILWDWDERRKAHELTGHTTHVFGLAFDPTGQRLYSGSRDRSVRVWDTCSGQALDVLTGHGQLIRSLDIHPDGTRLIAGSWFGDILIWDLERHDLVATFKGHSDIIYELAFDSQGDYFVSCSLDKTLQKFQRGLTRSE
jgi:WD40 repeat protein